ncbi:MAG TPA: polyprenyl synthetase family protein, partial [Polyangiales bacterium]|nr:polyprenyl synthetase family protein [Polyangiales bacterium]
METQREGDAELAIERALLASIPQDGPQAHLYRLVAEYPARGGKRIRPSLCLAACRAGGGRWQDALEAAVGLELLHNAFLVHDDIADASLQRRGAPTLHERFGVPLALNAGDGLFALALERVAAAVGRHPRLAGAILAEFAHMLRRSVEGQAIELGWHADRRWDIGDEQYLAMVRDKTCWYSFIHPLRLGTLIGSGRIADDAFVELGFLLGAVFQIRDDLDNLLANPATYDKDLGCDLVEAKRTLPVLHLLRTGTSSEVGAVQRHLGREAPMDPSQRLAAVVPLLERRGSLAHARSIIDALTAKAAREFEATF